jgi:hypothetical protein
MGRDFRQCKRFNQQARYQTRTQTNSRRSSSASMAKKPDSEKTRQVNPKIAKHIKHEEVLTLREDT